MKHSIVVLSGKGGAGKTTVSVNLAALFPALTISETGAECSTHLLDCDVEEPNAHVYASLSHSGSREEVFIPYPVIDEKRCTHCGACARFCAFHAIIATRVHTVTMPELCHGCLGCARVCPVGAITFAHRRVGLIHSERMMIGDALLSYGILDIGQLSSVRIIDRITARSRLWLDSLDQEGLVVIDAPPGTSCAAVAAAKGADFALLIAEPTTFGLHDLAMVRDLVISLGLPYGIVLNKTGIVSSSVWLPEESLPEEDRTLLLGSIPFSFEAAETLSRGSLLIENSLFYRRLFVDLASALMDQLSRREYES